MITEDQQSKIDYVIDNFNFAKVALVMEALDWRWGSEGGLMNVPSIAKLKQTSRHLLKSSIENNVVGSGGFRAEYHCELGVETFHLCFVIEELDSEFWLD
jgi:hypothetical protein